MPTTISAWAGRRADDNSRAGFFDQASNDDNDHDDMDMDSGDFDGGDSDTADAYSGLINATAALFRF
jgi:hypothetical protein